MTQKLVTFSDSVLRVDSATIYECWKSGDIVDVHFDGRTHFVSADFLTDLASEGLIHQDGICGKGWLGNTGFCKRVTKVKDKYTTARNAAIKKERLMTPEERNERTRKGLLIGGVIGGTIGLLADKGNRRAMGRNLNNFARKAGESAGRAASKYKRRGSQVSRSIGALPPGFRTITETL